MKIRVGVDMAIAVPVGELGPGLAAILGAVEARRGAHENAVDVFGIHRQALVVEPLAAVVAEYIRANALEESALLFGRRLEGPAAALIRGLQQPSRHVAKLLAEAPPGAAAGWTGHKADADGGQPGQRGLSPGRAAIVGVPDAAERRRAADLQAARQIGGAEARQAPEFSGCATAEADGREAAAPVHAAFQAIVPAH